MIKLKTLAAASLLLVTASINSVADQHASNDERLAAVIATRTEAMQARDSSRHPIETITFFGLKPGMTVAEVLPGGGWYTQILAPYVGDQGTIYGLNYADSMWPLFSFLKEEDIAEKIAGSAAFSDLVAGFTGAAGINAKGFAFDGIPASVNGTVDVVIMIRALHNLNRFEEQAATRSQALAQIHALLKPGGIVGVVQHRAPITAADDWANGSKGYLKQSAVIEMFNKAGFELVASSEINANAKDKPESSDYVWRLPPSLNTAADNKPAMLAIGESDRMTLKFVRR